MSSDFSVVPAAYAYLIRDRRVLLQRRRDTGYMDGHWVAGAAGHIEAHETATGCAIRELAEELGVEVTATDLHPVTVMQRTDGTDNPIEQRVDWFFTVQSWHGTPTIREPAKCDGLEWFDLDRLPSTIPAYERIVLDGIARGRLEVITDYGFGHAD